MCELFLMHKKRSLSVERSYKVLRCVSLGVTAAQTRGDQEGRVKSISGRSTLMTISFSLQEKSQDHVDRIDKEVETGRYRKPKAARNLAYDHGVVLSNARTCEETVQRSKKRQGKKDELQAMAALLEADVLAVCQRNNAHDQHQHEYVDDVKVLPHECSEPKEGAFSEEHERRRCSFESAWNRGHEALTKDLLRAISRMTFTLRM